MRPSRSTSALIALVLVCTSAARAQDPAREPIDSTWVRAHYTKREVTISVRDGVRLFTSIYEPRDRSRAYPILIRRTPYSLRPYGPDRVPTSLGPHDGFARDGFIFVYQDVRGRWMSEGEFVNVRPHSARKKSRKDIDESTDTYDTIEWLLKNVRNHNGRVGMWGISYPGFYTSAGMINAHPALRAASPQAPIADWFFDDFFHHGAFFLPHAFGFFHFFGQPRPGPTTEPPANLFDYGTPDGYEFYLKLGPLRNVDEKYFQGRVAFWNEIAAHPNRDAFWQARNILPHLRKVAPAVMTVGGWFDAEDLYGALQTYRALERQNPGIFNILVMGPWFHGGWARSDGQSLGDAWFQEKTAVFYRDSIELPFFRHFLKDDADPKLPEAFVFETGANRWRRLETWPPAEAVELQLYLREEGKLSFSPPLPGATDFDAFDEYVSDPTRPVPFTQDVALGMTREYMTEDQRFASRRPDVLSYVTHVLDEDLTLAGPITAELWVATTGTDADFVVKLIDVYPGDHPDFPHLREGKRTGGYQMLVRSEAIRGRFRRSYAAPEPFEPGIPTMIILPLQDVLHTFQKGHRVMVQIQSTWFPLVDRNPQKFVPNIFYASEADFTKATQRVIRSRDLASRLRVLAIPGQPTTVQP